MKKILSILFGALMLIGFTACEKGLEVTDANIVGKWELVKITVEGESEPGGQVWELAADHSLYVIAEGERISAGKWELDGKQLSTRFFPFPATVTKLTEKALTLELKDPYYGQVAAKYEFEKAD
jgi:hypothetical protein